MARSLGHALAPQLQGVLRGDVLRCDPWQNSAWVLKRDGLLLGQLAA